MHNPTLIHQFYSVCKDHANDTVLQSKKEKISYSELELRVNKVAGYLRSIGVESGDRVVIVIDNSIEYVTAFYATWKVGGIVVALNAHSKFHEIKNVITQTQAKCLIVDKIDHANVQALNSADIQLISLETSVNNEAKSWMNVLHHQVDDASLCVDESSLAQIIYTSGTTGSPKGVMLSHGNIMCNTLDIINYLELSEKDSVINVLPFHYSYGSSVLHTHVCVGAKVILAGSMAFPQEVVNEMRKYKATGFSGVPSTYSLLLSRSDWSKKPPAFRYITQAGGPMGKKLTEQLLSSLYSKTRLFVMYGQTEASARISWLPPESLSEKSGSVGVPLSHILLEIRDKQGNKLTNNQKGEVYVSGKSIMKGYWQNPEATKQVLIDGWLKTGDLGCLDNDGYLFLEGRNSDMIKVGAHRINPQELEEVINQLDFINESAVVGIEDEILGQKLRAFVVGDESKANLFALKKHCNEFLPAHKIPRDIKWVMSVPKTASGKIKRYQLSS